MHVLFAIYLAIYAQERSTLLASFSENAPVGSNTPVYIYHQFSPRQPGVCFHATHNKPPGGIDDDFHNLILSIKTGRTLLWIRPSMSLLFSIFLYFSGKLTISLISSGRCSRFSFLFHKITCLILSSVSETSLLRIASTT